MTLLEVYNNVLIEQNKNEAPSMLLEDFNYFFQKAVYKTTEDEYVAYGTHQIITDDLLHIKRDVDITTFALKAGTMQEATYDITLPEDYYHILGCTLKYKKTYTNRCNKTVDKIFIQGVAKLKENMSTGIAQNYYFKPSWKTPYYFFNSKSVSLQATNKQNPYPISMELRCGDNHTDYTPLQLHVDYIRIPKKYILTSNDIESETDNSMILEYSENMCYKIINNIMLLVLENTSDARLQSNVSINKPQTPVR